MFGFVVGTVCLVGLVRVLRGGRRWPHHGHGFHHHHQHHRHGCGYGHGGGGGGGGGHRGGRCDRDVRDDRFDRDERGAGVDDRDAGPVMLRGFFVRLQTTPGQERVIVDALRELKGAFARASAAQRKSARDLADALRGEQLSTEAMGGVFASLDEGVEAIRSGAFSSLTTIHEVLEPQQRQAFADLLARGGGLEDLARSV